MPPCAQFLPDARSVPSAGRWLFLLGQRRHVGPQSDGGQSALLICALQPSQCLRRPFVGKYRFMQRLELSAPKPDGAEHIVIQPGLFPWRYSVPVLRIEGRTSNTSSTQRRNAAATEVRGEHRHQVAATGAEDTDITGLSHPEGSI